jgi:hypothetical protein
MLEIAPKSIPTQIATAPPLQLRFEFALWTREMVAKHIADKFGIERQFGGPSAGATRHHLPEAVTSRARMRRSPGAAVA